MTDKSDYECGLNLGFVLASIGACTNESFSGEAHLALRDCMPAGLAGARPLSRAGRAVRAQTFADLRAARTALRHMRKLWIHHYGLGELKAVLDQYQEGWGGSIQGAAYGSSHAIGGNGVRLYWPKVPLEYLQIESGRIKGISSRLRRRLIRDGLTDSRMIDDQMAQDLGL